MLRQMRVSATPAVSRIATRNRSAVGTPISRSRDAPSAGRDVLVELAAVQLRGGRGPGAARTAAVISACHSSEPSRNRCSAVIPPEVPIRVRAVEADHGVEVHQPTALVLRNLGVGQPGVVREVADPDAERAGQGAACSHRRTDLLEHAPRKYSGATATDDDLVFGIVHRTSSVESSPARTGPDGRQDQLQYLRFQRTTCGSVRRARKLR
jgi:hypothetical protein